MRVPSSILIATVCLAGCATGCTSPEAGAATSAARAFAGTVATDPARACTLLAPPAVQQLTKDGPCPQALQQTDPQDPGALREVEVSGRSAIARFASDTYFLAKYADGWRVTAAVCQPPDGADRPYDCEVSAD